MKTISALDLMDLVGDLNFMPSISDSLYAVPAREWIINRALPSFHVFLKDLSVLGYSQQCWDCDDFALAFMFFARMLHARTQSAFRSDLKTVDQKQCGIAIGQMWYTRDAGGQHAINCAIVDDNELIFFEPQQVALPILNLSFNEKLSCEFLQF